MLEGDHRFSKIGIVMGVVIGGAADFFFHNTILFVIMRMKLYNKIGVHNLMNWNQIKKGYG